jgi:hypothetical protein
MNTAARTDSGHPLPRSNTMTTQELAARLDRSYAVRRYRDRYFYNPRDAAQDALIGRTHYVNTDTLRFHHSRILSARPIFDGLFFRITESCSLDPDNTRRGFRCVVFDIFGETVYRPSLEICRASRDPAERDCTRWLETFDPVGYYRETLEKRAARMNKDAAALLEVIDSEVTA